MEKTDRETRDFMTVESFSQLPFIRGPTPPPLKETNAIIRLFGQEFGNNTDNNHSNLTDNNNADSNNISSRKFECHYCCRNFPTSQALGGHQNAHRRERQQAKRAHLQSAIGLSDVYGRAPTCYNSWNNGATARLYSSAYYNTMLHAGYSSYNASPQPQPINGSPLGVWRNIPTANFGSPAQQNRLSSIRASIPSSQLRFGCESKPDMQDQVSLDLHL